jgi:hypothetical protein
MLPIVTTVNNDRACATVRDHHPLDQDILTLIEVNRIGVAL